ncbi:MAG: AMP-binding protein [Candidatus Eremiobacteraeota bacterium]|nr:AMP-binding protein [Candidatus Eremiobacteraeota bacterium]
MLAGCVPWPPELAERYRREGYWRGEVLGELTRRWARSDGRRTALVTPSETWSYAEVDGAADRLAAGLHRLGIAPRDRVLVQLPNVPSFVVVSLALFRLGALPVFALASHRRSEMIYLAEYAEAVAYVVPDTFQGFDYRALAREVRAAVPALEHVLVAGDADEFLALSDVDADPFPLPAPSPADVAFFLLSGGTTGRPKLIPRTHDDYAYQLRATAEALGHDEHGVYLAALPAAHNAALGCPGVLGTLRAGGKIALAPSPSPDEVFALIRAVKPTLTTLMPQLVTLWLETAPYFDVDLRDVVLQVGGAMLQPDVARRVRPALGCTLTHWFGMSEGFLSFTRLEDSEDVAASTQGRPMSPADEVRAIDAAGDDVEPGAVGELLVRGPTTLRGYYRAEEYNATAFTPDGYLRTSDLVRIDPAGNMVVEGRIKDIINRGGEKVSAEEVESHLLAHPDVREAAVVAMPDRMMGEKTCAFLVARRDARSASEIRDFLRARGMAEYKLPDRVEYVEALPRTNVGKVNRAVLGEEIARRVR